MTDEQFMAAQKFTGANNKVAELHRLIKDAQFNVLKPERKKEIVDFLEALSKELKEGYEQL